MEAPRKKMGRPLEDVPLRKLIKSIRQDLHEKLAVVEPAEASAEPRKQKRRKQLASTYQHDITIYSLRQVNNLVYFGYHVV
jgi:hypothetical protein